ncbi:hypothetical protein EDI_210900, partial [Entamoeba dispar SAW760]
MNYNVIKALDQEETGDLIKYFNYTDGILEANSGVHDNKCLSIDSSDPPCPVQKGMYTKLKLTDESIQITNIDKSSITALVNIKIKPSSQFWNELKAPGISNPEFDNKCESIKNQTVVFFVGLKSSTHLFDAYRVYSRNKKTSCEQTEALYENAAIRMLKAQEELDYKPGIYTQWETAYNMEDNICGCYISMEEFIKSPDNTVEKEFEVIIPIDDLLPFAAMKMFPNALFGNLTLEVKMAIQQNFVICQCKQETILNKISHISSSSYSGSDEIKDNITEVIKSDIYNIIKRNGEYHAFTQIGDSFNVHSFTGALRESQNIIVGKDTTVSFMITDGSLKYCRTNI